MTIRTKTAISSWGRLRKDPHEVVYLNDPQRIAEIIANSLVPGIAHGMGRSYGDVCLNPDGILWKTSGLDRFIEFDEVTGRLRCEAGVTLGEIQRLAIPRGWMLPVTPGTQYVTVGGAIANDVHGKNHHRMGSFGHHVQSLTLVRTSGEVMECSPQLHPGWFAATVGGLGLTGVIIKVDIQLQPAPSAWLEVETIPYNTLAEFFRLADDSEVGWGYTVSWLDCLCTNGRGIFLRANALTTQQETEPHYKKRKILFTPPFCLVNKFTLLPFNKVYYHFKKWRSGRTQMHYEPFFYPLDHLLEWNRLYGPRGFFQYQSVVPRKNSAEAIRLMLKEIAKSGEGSFLAVLKTFGNQQSIGMMSFPQPGVTLALDFPNKGVRTLKLFNRLDAVVREAGGRIYLAKDARVPPDFFEESYPRLNEFLDYRDPGISSALSRRLIGN